MNFSHHTFIIFNQHHNASISYTSSAYRSNFSQTKTRTNAPLTISIIQNKLNSKHKSVSLSGNIIYVREILHSTDPNEKSPRMTHSRYASQRSFIFTPERRGGFSSIFILTSGRGTYYNLAPSLF